MTAELSAPLPIAMPPQRWWALHVSGDLDLVTGPDLDARLGRAMALHHGDGLVLNLSGVPFMDCAGLGPVLRARNRLAERFCLSALRPRVLRLLDLTGVKETLRILPDGGLWPTEADPQRCRVVLDDLFDHRPAQPPVRLGGAPAMGSPQRFSRL